ncbi:MAG TPA: sirohydrochlorin chelatase [Bacillales bacterium]|nr:sirohydrochlorin chelatase [Bacillales bacterium]
MEALLFIGHGSRVKKGVRQALDFMKKCTDDLDVPIREFCFLELAEPSIEEGMARCVERGADHITVLPLLLLEAGHAKRDIPLELQKAQQHYPHIQVNYGKPFGVHTAIIDILIERIHEQGRIKDDDSVLIVGRGSSDPGIKDDFAEIVRLLKRKYSCHKVQTSYLAAAQPRFEDVVDQLRTVESSQIFVVPYLLFTGVLMNDMRREITEANRDGKARFVLCDSLGYHPNFKKVVRERVAEATRLARWVI